MKRKYTRKVTGEIVAKDVKGGLPPDILANIDKICEHRKSLGLFDDREDRIQRALLYQEFIRGKTVNRFK